MKMFFKIVFFSAMSLLTFSLNAMQHPNPIVHQLEHGSEYRLHNMDTDTERLELVNTAVVPPIVDLINDPIRRAEIKRMILVVRQPGIMRRSTDLMRNFFLRWGLPIRFDVGPRETLRAEGRRVMTAWNRPALRTFFIFLGEITVLCVLLQISNSLGSYRSEINDRLIPWVNTAISPDGQFSKHTYGGHIYFTPATRLEALRKSGESLLCLSMMPLIQSYIAFFGIHATEDLFCSIGRVAWAYLQGLFVGQAQPRGNAH